LSGGGVGREIEGCGGVKLEQFANSLRFGFRKIEAANRQMKVDRR